jgi:hypothetical protein
VRLGDSTIRLAELHWYEATWNQPQTTQAQTLPGLTHGSTKAFRGVSSERRLEVSLEKRKIYEVLPDVEAAYHDQIRVIDESGEDYLYPESFFVEIELPQPLRRALTASV